ncbi:acid protease [Mycena belliarum]|uniref:Acid protease n=1 Tax=Mycena belliarum TaxID=1033014 RepID=A0AAD6XHT2_9AGAR|nr:acid protease [Mycena belliae]
MLINRALIVAVTLAVSATAAPTRVPTTASGISIPLRKRATYTQQNGVFDKDKAIAASVGTINKHRQNLLNLVKNVGDSALHYGAEIKAPAVLPYDVERRMKKRQAEALIDLENDVEWAGTISIGTPAREFLIDFDTGSADLWVPSAACTSVTCEAKSKFNANLSSTAEAQVEKFSILYGDGSSVLGPVYTDTVTVAGIQATKQYFSAVTTLSASFAADPIDGVLGLAFPAISNLNHSPFFNTAKAEGSLAVNQFGFCLAANNSELYLGGTNAKKFVGDIEYHAIDTTTGFWQLTTAEVKVGSATAVAGIETIIDSGTTIMYGPPAAVKEVYAKVAGSALYDAANGYYSYPCDSAPEIAFNWGGADWAISAANFNLGKTEEGSKLCVGALAGQDLGLGAGVWLLGDSFMKNVYTAFDFELKAVGFAKLA